MGIRVFETSLLQSMDGDGTFISIMAQNFQQDYQYDAFGRMTSVTSPLFGGADGGLFYPTYDVNGNVTESAGNL